MTLSLRLRKLAAKLRAELAAVNRAIADLELLADRKGRRGRTFMPLAERRQVSERMRRYWQKRKAKS